MSETLCAVTDGVILRVKSQLFLSLEGKAAMAAPILVHVTLRDGPHWRLKARRLVGKGHRRRRSLWSCSTRISWGACRWIIIIIFLFTFLVWQRFGGSIFLTVVAVVVTAAVVVIIIVVQPMRSFHEHEKSLKPLRVDGVDVHDVGLQVAVVVVRLLAERTSARWGIDRGDLRALIFVTWLIRVLVMRWIWK